MDRSLSAKKAVFEYKELKDMDPCFPNAHEFLLYKAGLLSCESEDPGHVCKCGMALQIQRLHMARSKVPWSGSLRGSRHTGGGGEGLGDTFTVF